MRVERCPACAARYDVKVLIPGATFKCRRCGADVSVGSGPSEEGPVRRAWALVAVAVTMFASLFLYANPTFGAKAVKWPWQHWVDCGSPMVRVDFLLWTVSSIVAVIVALGYGGPRRFLILAPLAGLLLFRVYAEPSAFQVTWMELHWMISAVALGAGFLLEAADAPAHRGAARALELLGAIGIVSIFAMWFPDSTHPTMIALGIYAKEMRTLFRGHLPVQEIWDHLLPQSLQYIACLLGVTLAAIPSARAVAVRRVAAAVGLALLFMLWLEPLAATTSKNRDAIFGSGGKSSAAGLLVQTLFDSGLMAWCFATFSFAAIVRSIAPKDSSAPAPLEAANSKAVSS